jgi:hypothetical protein
MQWKILQENYYLRHIAERPKEAPVKSNKKKFRLQLEMKGYI